MKRLLLLFLTIACVAPSFGHEVRPAYLQLEGQADGSWHVLWKQPVMQDRRLPIDPIFPDTCEMTPSQAPEFTGAALLERWTTTCDLSQAKLRINGLSRTLTDVMLQVRAADGTSESYLLRPESPEIDLANAAPPAFEYLWLGIEHLLFGIDHVLFVIGLVLFIPGRMDLLKTITAFTIAHSITLALSVLEIVSVPQAPVEAIIALSILFLARELVLPEERRSALTRARPWVMALVFGLLHGLGFAGVLAEIGLPKDQLALSLLLFNVGIELGQIIVIIAVLALMWLVRLALRSNAPVQAYAWAMGCVAGMWTLERVFAVF